MKFGVHSGLWMARWTDDVAPILRVVADLGFDGVEVSLLGMTDDRAAAMAGLIRDHGLQVTCSDGLSREADITSDDAEVRQAGLAHLRSAVRRAVRIGTATGCCISMCPTMTGACRGRALCPGIRLSRGCKTQRMTAGSWRKCSCAPAIRPVPT